MRQSVIGVCAQDIKSSHLSLLYVNVAKDGSWCHMPGTGITSCYVTKDKLSVKNTCPKLFLLIFDCTILVIPFCFNGHFSLSLTRAPSFDGHPLAAGGMSVLLMEESEEHDIH